jgi:tetratricopeptide (TPR) repeat protein
MKCTRIPALLAAVAVAGVLASDPAYGASQSETAAKAQKAQKATGWNEVARNYQSYRTKHDQDYVMWTMDYASCCLLAGNYDEAFKALAEARKDIKEHEDKGRENLAALGRENIKLFKGEPYERAMLNCYLGLMHYMDADYNNARIFFAQANKEDATSGDDMKDFRDDFGLAHYWLGRSYLKLDQADNARVAFRKASQFPPHKGQDKELANLKKVQDRARKDRVKVEQDVYKTASTGNEAVPGVVDMSVAPAVAELPAQMPGWTDTDPAPVQFCTDKAADFFTVDYQQQVNLILIVEMGTAPVKIANDYGDQIVPSPYNERGGVVFVDGHRAGPTFPVLDLYHQAATRGKSEKDTGQVAKAVTKQVLKQVYGVGLVAGFWDIRADDRYWHMLPGEVHLFAARVKPGLHTITIQCQDANGYVLPRYRMTCYYIPVHADEDNVYIVRTRAEADNVYTVASK